MTYLGQADYCPNCGHGRRSCDCHWCPDCGEVTVAWPVCHACEERANTEAERLNA